ncbi:MAG TPA: UDP-N-acetylmuramoyl-L-alanine--D-glutamate ligase [Gammaproteobacteria bacterium]|nr:UDP-N-acetylmuramoyl-L-alanine--D-glutamate ligase [Gammaproteobacteria bacterium]
MRLQTTGTRTLIVGLGRTGLACARFLVARGVELAVTDSRERPPGLKDLREQMPDVAVFVGGFSEDALQHADQLVVSPGIPVSTPFVMKARVMGLPVLGDIELFAQHARAPVIGITGSNGKSTVTTLVGLMAEQAGRKVRIGGNLGTPALELLSGTEPELYVLELSSFQLETTDSLHCTSATVLNVSPDHMDRYATLDEYAAAKARVFRHCDTAVLNRDDPRVRDMGAAAGTRISFGLGAPRAQEFGLVLHAGERWLAHGETRLLAASSLHLHGDHNLANALAALALGEAAGLPMPAMLSALQRFRGLPHRMEFVTRVNDVDWYDDSKGTNVGATLAAVSGLAGPLVLIAGGDGKGQDFTPLAAALVGKVRAVVLLGRDAAAIEAAIAGRLPIERVQDMPAAVQAAARHAQPGDRVLLSPACSSLDMFDNFEHRGRVFAQAARRLADG